MLTHLEYDRRCDDRNEHKTLAGINSHRFSEIHFWQSRSKARATYLTLFPLPAPLFLDRRPLRPAWSAPSIGHGRCVSPLDRDPGIQGPQAIFDHSQEVRMSTNVVSVLNDLVETSKDGEKGFRKAAEDTKDTTLKQLFTGRAEDCARGAHELQDVVQRLGGKPQTGGTVGGALHRGWVDIKSAVTHRSDHAILEECERGEDVAKKNYRDALDKELPADVRAVVERQYQGVIENHDRIRDLRDQYAAAKP